MNQEQIGWILLIWPFLLSSYYVPCSKLNKTNPILSAWISLFQELWILLLNEAALNLIESLLLPAGNCTHLDLYALRGEFCLSRSQTLGHITDLLCSRRDIWHIRGSSSPKCALSPHFWLMTLWDRWHAYIYVYMQVFQVLIAIITVHFEVMLNRQSCSIVTVASTSCF